ncbi:MAG: exopolyphosphatase [Firmicutes bacterium]|nr:exopolyphosphatase [Bacillota bacterium]
MEEKLAIIDLGSNSVRMIIMKIYDNGSYKMIDQAKEMVRLSEGMAEDNILKPVAVQRTVEALKLFRRFIEYYDVENTIAVATAGVRNAANGEEFIAKVAAETGFKFDVIPGEMEAYYDYLGVINTIDVDDCVILDIGGGSTEIIRVEKRRVRNSVSIPFGAVNMTEKFLGKGETEVGKLGNLEKIIRDKLRGLGWLDDAAGLPVIGLGGSVRTVAKINKREKGYFIEGLHNYIMEPCEVQEVYAKVTAATISERKEISGLQKDRADIISGGLVPLKVLMEYIDSPMLVVSGNGLREGVFFKQYLEKLGFKDEIVTNVLQHSIFNTLKKYDAGIQHSYHIRKLSLEMYDQLQELHGLGRKYRKLLEVGALLHDIGLYLDYYNHHSHGFYLALNSGINGINNRELVICAFIIGMHRSESLKKDWNEYKLYMDKSDYEAVKKLSLFVRIAEELDRNEYGSVEAMHCSEKEDRVKINLVSGKASEPGSVISLKCGKDFRKVFGRNLEVLY